MWLSCWDVSIEQALEIDCPECTAKAGNYCPVFRRSRKPYYPGEYDQVHLERRTERAKLESNYGPNHPEVVKKIRSFLQKLSDEENNELAHQLFTGEYQRGGITE